MIYMFSREKYLANGGKNREEGDWPSIADGHAVVDGKNVGTDFTCGDESRGLWCDVVLEDGDQLQDDVCDVKDSKHEEPTQRKPECVDCIKITFSGKCTEAELIRNGKTILRGYAYCNDSDRYRREAGIQLAVHRIIKCL